MDLFELANQYEEAEVYDSISDGKRIVFRREGSDYLEVILWCENTEWRYIHDNFPGQRRFFSSNIPVTSMDDFESDLKRMNIPVPKRK